ncbi:RNA ligase family protein [Sediminitomix flava]|uniref:RNA ligase n=1 Tax=Sediminitomix flava TaxID=379075 RepID=A0A316A0L1_SEDFL|nr:RNA ligase family protein [Sediminitomix flava]PWJ43177.1 RNA ligase [Sediminitomix flava]
MEHARKYCRTLHAQISKGTTSDDRFMPEGYVRAFAEMEQMVLTEKLDGQNNCFNRYGVFARSHAAPSQLPWDKPMRERWELIKNDLKDVELFGENMYGIHSIGYHKLESYFYVFAVRIKDKWLSWEEVKFYAALFDFPTVPEIPIQTALTDVFHFSKDENQILAEWLRLNLEMTWEESVETEGLLGGYDPTTGKACSEGFVIRNAESYSTNSGRLAVASNEFDSLMKLVRKAHVKTDVHWTKNWNPSKLIDYQKYHWFAYEYLSKQ